MFKEKKLEKKTFGVNGCACHCATTAWNRCAVWRRVPLTCLLIYLKDEKTLEQVLRLDNNLNKEKSTFFSQFFFPD